MTRYLLAVHTAANGEAREPMSDEQMRQGFEAINALEADMRSAGALLFSGRLEDTTAAAVVRSTGDRTLTTDGPFAEAKEAIGGFYIIEADNREAALSWASRTSAIIGKPIEVRPFLDSRS